MDVVGSVLAHAGTVDGGGGTIALEIILISVLVVIWAALGVVCWIFWKAKKRDEAEELARGGPEWRSVRSS